MKKISLTISAMVLVCLVLTSFSVSAQNSGGLDGAWEGKAGEGRMVMLFQDGYATASHYTASEFKSTSGGPYTLAGNRVTVDIEFSSNNKDMVGTRQSMEFKVSGDELTVKMDGMGDREMKLQRIDGGEAPLAGVWQITDRMEDGNLVPIQRSGTRKTLKMLTGTRFQWFAIDPATKLFAGTGGGTYTFEDGKYTENIEFFSRDNSRVGASLSFDGALKDGGWHHSGLSSKGDKIYEVWGRSK
jgi:hypothetical protein